MATPAIAPVNASATAPANAALVANAQQPSTPTGVAAAPTTLAPAAAPAGPAESGYCKNMIAALTKCLNHLRNFLAKIPGFGWLATEAVVRPLSTDAERVNAIQHALNDGHIHVAVSEATIAGALAAFGEIQSPASRWEAFKEVLTGDRTTDVIARRFYDALSEEQKTQFRKNIWIENNRSDTDANGVVHYCTYGDHIVETAICSPQAVRAAEALQRVEFACQQYYTLIADDMDRIRP